MEKVIDFFPEGLERTGPAFFSRTPRLLSIDFDGTLSEIAPTPASARMTDRFKTLLWALSMIPQTKLAILSGRALPDLRQKVKVPGIVMVGNHGLDFSPAAMGWSLSEISDWTRRTQEARVRLEPLVKRWPGTLLEPKGPDLSLHYRLLEPAQAKRLIPEALEALEGLPVVPHQGKCVLDIRPKGAPGKGEALERLISRFLEGRKEGICVHLGDDRTDEDAFQVLQKLDRNALGLKVGEGPTHAHYRLEGLGEVHRFLSLFLEEHKD